MIKYFQLSVTSEVVYLLAIACFNTHTLDGMHLQTTDVVSQVFQSAEGYTPVDPTEVTSVQSVSTSSLHEPRYRTTQNHGGLLSHLVSKPDFLNGTVINHYGYRILCWTGEPSPYSGNARFFYLEPEQASPPEIDVDHVQDPSGQWWKVGWSTVSVDASGAVTDAKCKTSRQNQACEK